MKSVLIFEPHPYHYELLPSAVYAFELLDYQITVMTRTNCDYEDVFCRCHFKNHIHYLHYQADELESVLRDDKAAQYDYIFFTSLEFFHGEVKERLFDYLGYVPGAKYGILGIYHNMKLLSDDDIEFIKDGRIFGISPYEFKGCKIPQFSPSYFGDIFESSFTGKKIKAVMAGGSNYRLMAEYSYRRLTAGERKNFIIEDIGKRHMLSEAYNRIGHMFLYAAGSLINKADRKHQASIAGWMMVKKKGYVNFSKLYEIVNDADFILIGMDIKILAYQDFLHGKTSGSKQLALAFGKPCIIQKQFAQAFGFDETNSIIYEDKMETALKRAASMGREEYEQLNEGIRLLARKTWEQSLQNLTEAVNRNRNKNKTDRSGM